MFKTESKIKSLLAMHLESEGFEVHKEFRVPEGYRVDLLAIRDDLRYGIEVKTSPRDISNDISKGTILHGLPEFDYIYAAGPKMLIPNELLGFAKQTRVGVIGIEEERIEWLQKSELLEPSQLLGGASLPGDVVSPGDSLEIRKHVSVHGGKVVRDLEMFFIPSGPFITLPKEKSCFKLKKLEPGKPPWEETFKIKVKKSSREGTYPLYISCMAPSVPPSQSVFYIEIKKASNQKEK